MALTTPFGHMVITCALGANGTKSECGAHFRLFRLVPLRYNHMRPHQDLGMRPPITETLVEKPPNSGADQGDRHFLNRAQAFV